MSLKISSTICLFKKKIFEFKKSILGLCNKKCLLSKSVRRILQYKNILLIPQKGQWNNYENINSLPYLFKRARDIPNYLQFPHSQDC